MIAIKNTKMPVNCRKCPRSTICPVYLKMIINESSTSSINQNERPAKCPLVEIITCKECKHWKDNDGVYRRGIGAESKCPINIKEVFEGNFYCAYAEKKEQ